MTDPGGSKSADAYRTISEVAADLKLPQHVLRFWETRFSQVKPLKRAGGRRFYRPEDVELLRAVKALLYGEGYTIKGVQRILREQGPRAVAALAASPARRGQSGPPPTDATEAARPSPPVRVDPASIAAGPRSPASATRPDPEAATTMGRLRTVLAEIEDCARLLVELKSTAHRRPDGA